MRAISLILFLIFNCSLSAQENSTVKFSELHKLQQQNPRPVLVKIYTGWCGICKIQDKQVAKSQELKTLLAQNFYYLELDAETKQEITFNAIRYTFIPHGLTGGVHALAAQFNPAGSYPAWVLLSSDYKILWQYNGLIKPDDWQALIKAAAALR